MDSGCTRLRFRLGLIKAAEMAGEWAEGCCRNDTGQKAKENNIISRLLLLLLLIYSSRSRSKRSICSPQRMFMCSCVSWSKVCCVFQHSFSLWGRKQQTGQHARDGGASTHMSHLLRCSWRIRRSSATTQRLSASYHNRPKQAPWPPSSASRSLIGSCLGARGQASPRTSASGTLWSELTEVGSVCDLEFSLLWDKMPILNPLPPWVSFGKYSSLLLCRQQTLSRNLPGTCVDVSCHLHPVMGGCIHQQTHTVPWRSHTDVLLMKSATTDSIAEKKLQNHEAINPNSTQG